MSTAQYKCDVNNLAGPDNLLVLDDGRILVGEDTYHHESNMVWLWGEKIEASNVDENLTLNHVKLVNAPTGNDSTWTYGYQTEVNDLQIGLTYTAFMTVKEVGDEDLKGFWLWNGIETNGEQYDQTFSLQAGCYSINASLYESDDLNADAKNASLVSYAHSDFVVGNGACTNGEYADGPTEPQEETKEVADVGIPGFGSLLSITAALGALLVTSRRSLRDNHFE